MITRRRFAKQLLLSGAGAGAWSGLSARQFRADQGKIAGGSNAFIPMPLQVVIDDVGWWSGEDGSKEQEPYRTGISRNHVPADYRAIVELGRSLGIRPQAAFVLCEWDSENILREVPTSTWMGRDWNNEKWVGPWLEESAEIIRNNPEHFEITIHGLGHEYWEGGYFTRAEWTDSEGQMRPADQVELHLEYFGRLLHQHNLGAFPKSFVPAAFRHSFGPSAGQEVALAELLKKWGVDYINTPFSSMFNRERVQYRHFGIDSGVMTVDRGQDEFPWFTFPAIPSLEMEGPTCGMHWPNLLHPDPERDPEVVGRWVEALKPYDERPEMMLARNSVAFQNQLVHHELTRMDISGNSVELDFRETDRLFGADRGNRFTLKVASEKPLQFLAEGLSILSVSGLGSGPFVYRLDLERENGKRNARVRFHLSHSTGKVSQ